VKLLHRPSGCHDKFQLSDALSTLDAAGFKVRHLDNFLNSGSTPIQWLKRAATADSVKTSGEFVTINQARDAIRQRGGPTMMDDISSGGTGKWRP
jgi:predicted oxidoreductase